MCGIAGIIHINRQPVDRSLVLNMARSLAHRGPDGDSFYVKDYVGLAHRRLSIIDLSTGDQPMFSDDGNIVIIYNGEMYNFKEVKDKLQKLGHVFRTKSDTEVIIHAYQEWKENCLHEFRGMFAFVLWDAANQIIFAARDRIGIKPFYYYCDDKKFLFGSEIKAILQDTSIDRHLNHSALLEYLQFGYVPQPRSIYQTIHKLPPAHYLRIDLNRGGPELKPYWNFSFSIDDNQSETRWLEEIEGCLSETIKQHMISDVPIGAFLSGGVDSSTVSAFMAKHTPNLKTFTIGLNEEGFDERPFAQQVADRLHSEHFEKNVIPEDIRELLPKLVWHYDEPFADSSAVPTYYISKVIRENVTVALSGDGGDEIFGGYKRYIDTLEYFSQWSQTSELLKHMKALTVKAARIAPAWFIGKNFIQHQSQHPLQRYYGSVNIFKDDQIQSLVRQQVPYRNSWFDEYYDHGRDFLSNMQNIDIHTYLPENNLTKVDRASMAHSIEVRVPLLDHKLIELVARTPARIRMKNGETKYLLKKITEKYLPTEVLYRRKRGFSLPMKDWFKGDASLMEYASHTILGNEFIKEQFRTDIIEKMIAEHTLTSKNHAPRIWSLLFLSVWYDTYYKKM